jgi:hypothetical protein
MKTQNQYTAFVGDINLLKVELIKASQEGRKPILMNTESYIEEGRMKQRHVYYTVIFEQTVIQGS